MFCEQCGTKMDDNRSVCPACGKDYSSSHEEKAGSKSDQDGMTTQKMNEANPDLFETSTDLGEPPVLVAEPIERKRGSKGKVIGISLLAVVTIIAVVVFAVVSNIPPALSEERITSDFDAEAYAAGELTQSVWGINEGYEVESVEIADKQNYEYEDVKQQEVTINLVVKNDSFKVDSQWTVVYELIDKEWVMVDSLELSRSVAPTSGVPDEKILEQVPSYIQMVDEEPAKDADGYNIYLSDYFDENFSSELVDNATSESGGQATVAISSQKGLAGYTGTLTVDFVWNGQDWEYASCSVDAEAYKADYSSLAGEHDFILAKPGGGLYSDTHRCYGGKNQPLCITVKSVDSQAMTMIVDMSFILHNHKSPSNATESSDEDLLVDISDVMLPLEVGKSYKAYSLDDPTSSSGYEIKITIEEDGLWTVEVKSTVWVYFESRVGFSVYDTYEVVL